MPEPRIESNDDTTFDQSDYHMPQRHGCVTTYLIFGLIINSIIALYYLIAANNLARILNVSLLAVSGLILAGIINTICAFLLLRYRKIGFYGFALSSICIFALNVYIGNSPLKCTLGIIGVGILYAILQMKKNGVSAWEYLN